MIKTRRALLCIVGFGLLLSQTACAGQAHTWLAQNPLILVDQRGPEGHVLSEHPYPPHLILYADGQLFITTVGGVQEHIYTKQLTRQEVCALLNTIDQFGYFDYNASSYSRDNYGRPIENYSVSDFSNDEISVNAWRSKSISLYALGYYVGEAQASQVPPEDSFLQSPAISPALGNTYRLLWGYLPAGLEVYEPESLELWMIQRPDTSGTPKRWPLAEPSLASLVSHAKTVEEYGMGGESVGKVVLSGTQARQVFDLFDQSLDERYFTDGETTVQLYALPVLPYQAETPGSATPTPTSWSCTPADGELIP